MHIEKIEKLIAMLRAHPKGYDQSCWAQRYGPHPTLCGTSACLAGYAVLMEGYETLFRKGELVGHECVDGHGEIFLISDIARRILGLNKRTAKILFDGGVRYWRHTNEFFDADDEDEELDVAVRELWDLIRLGDYPPLRKRKSHVHREGRPHVPQQHPASQVRRVRGQPVAAVADGHGAQLG